MEKESWYVKITKENREDVRNFMKSKSDIFNSFVFNIGAIYGYIYSTKDYYGYGNSNYGKSLFDNKEITTEEFYRKLGKSTYTKEVDDFLNFR